MAKHWPAGAHKLLSALDSHVPRSRTVLLALSAISGDDWAEAIRFLLADGLAVKQGATRGTTYLLAKTPCAPQFSATTSGGSAFVATDYHDLLSDVLRELLPIEEAEPSSSDRTLQMQIFGLVPGDKSETHAVRAPPSSAVRKMDCRIVHRLNLMGVVDIVDLRDRQGCLWVLDVPGAEAAVGEVIREFGVRFYFKAKGGRATAGQPAWWTTGK